MHHHHVYLLIFMSSFIFFFSTFTSLLFFFFNFSFILFFILPFSSSYCSIILFLFLLLLILFLFLLPTPSSIQYLFFTPSWVLNYHSWQYLGSHMQIGISLDLQANTPNQTMKFNYLTHASNPSKIQFLIFLLRGAWSTTVYFLGFRINKSLNICYYTMPITIIGFTLPFATNYFSP